MRLLLTRPEPDAARTAAALRTRGHEVVRAPLLRIEIIADAALGDGPWAAIAVTSANAAPAVAQHPRRDELLRLPVFAVGRRSAEAMRAAGCIDVSSADGDAGDLAALIARHAPAGGPLLYLAGAERARDLAGALAAQGISVHMAVVYRAHVARELPRSAAEALADGCDGVLHFSRRSADAYVGAATHAGLLAAALAPVQFCLSGRTAEPLARAGAAAIRIAPQPQEAALLAMIETHWP